jgi:hypothetical protein
MTVQNDLVVYVFNCVSPDCIDGEFVLNANRKVDKLHCPYCGNQGNFFEPRPFTGATDEAPVEGGIISTHYSQGMCDEIS